MPSGQQKPRRKPFKVLGVIFVFLVIIYGLFSLTSKPEEEPATWYDRLPFISQLKHLAQSADAELKGEDRDRINILLLGIGGKGHDGAYLTDTIILASIQPKEKKVALISIPRDMSIPVGNTGWQKINSINAYAEMKTVDSGGEALSQAVSDLFGLPVDYYLTVDFTGFEKVIDDLGGIKVNVENTLDDYNYPILGNEDAAWDQRWEHLHIDAGEQTMDGELALKYVRSRHGVGVEGSDFARSRRQQKVLEAVKEKVLSINTLFRPGMISDIMGDLKENYQTNLKIWEIIKLWSIVKDIEGQDITNRVLDNGPDGFLVDSTGEDGAYLLIPSGGDFSEIRYMIKNIFSQTAAEKEKISTEQKASVEVRNGTKINGLASQVASSLEKYGFDVARVGNSSQKNSSQSIIYDLTYGAKIQALQVLKNNTGASVELGMPQWLMDEIAKEVADEKNPTQPDFILLLGESARPQ